MKKRAALVVLSLAMAVSCAMSGCGRGKSSASNRAERNKEGVIEYTMISGKTGEDEAAPYFAASVERFNEKNEGKYHITLQGSTNYHEKLQQLIKSGNIPTIFEEDAPDFNKNYMIPKKTYYDLSEFLDSHPEIKDICIDSSLKYVTQEDGSICSMPNVILNSTGVWYNTKLYSPSKPIKEMTWDEFIDDLGENKIALQTGDGAFQIDLLIPALMAQEKDGISMMNEWKKNNCTDFTTAEWKNVFTKVKEIYDAVGWEGGIGANYADAANSFMSANSSVIFNGVWISANLKEDVDGNWSNGFNGADVTCDIYPGNITVGNPDTYTWWINPEANEDELELSYAWLEHYYSQDEIEERLLSLGGTAPKLEYSEEFKTALAENQFSSALTNAIEENTTIVPEYYYFCSASAMEEMSKLLPSLLDGSMSIDEFCEEMTAKELENSEK